MGFISANKSTLIKTLQHPQKRSIVLVPGGAAEALMAHPGTFKLYLRNRRGFVKLAVETNTPLVPVLGFGENELFYTLDFSDQETTNSNGQQEGNEQSTLIGRLHSKLWSVQQRIRKTLSFSTPIFNPIPKQDMNVTVVVGLPLPIDPNKTIDEHHALYVERLQALFEKHKGPCGYGHLQLEIE